MLQPLSFLRDDHSGVFTGAHPHAVSEYVNQHVGSHGLSLSHHSAGGASLSHRKAGCLDLCRLSYGAQARVVSEGLPGTYHVQFILRGHCLYQVHRDPLSLSAGHMLLINPDEPIDLTYSSDCEKFIVKVPTAMLDDACTEHRWLRPRESVRFSQTPYRFEEIDSLLYLLNLLCQEAESGTATPQMLQHYNRVVTSKLMTLLQHNVSLGAPASHSVSFERLVQYIDEHIRRDLTAEELARHANLSLRSLYLLFEKNARMTPKAFIRQHKLQHVHATLAQPGPRPINVTAVALDYGFTHLGRFSQAYQAAFGALPSETLKAALSHN